MTDVKGGYLRPTTTTRVSCSWQCHRDRPKPSSEPGTDYACAYGSALVAPEDGVIVDLSTSTSGATGRYITIDLNDGQRIRLLHLARVIARRGQRVKRGQDIAKSGASGFGREWGYGAHVHVTLWGRHGYAFGRSATLDFEKFLGADNDNVAPAAVKEQWVADVQNALNHWFKAGLVVDGILGKRTTKAIYNAQVQLQKEGLYKGKLDGIWGPQTNTALNRHRDRRQTKPSPQYHTATVNDLAELKGNVGGFQKIAHLYGYNQKNWLDFRWGPGTARGMQRFLDQNYGGSLAAWLRAKYGYKGNDQWGPNMRAAAIRAEVANYRAL